MNIDIYIGHGEVQEVTTDLQVNYIRDLLMDFTFFINDNGKVYWLKCSDEQFKSYCDRGSIYTDVIDNLPESVDTVYMVNKKSTTAYCYQNKNKWKSIDKIIDKLKDELDVLENCKKSIISESSFDVKKLSNIVSQTSNN